MRAGFPGPGAASAANSGKVALPVLAKPVFWHVSEPEVPQMAAKLPPPWALFLPGAPAGPSGGPEVRGVKVALTLSEDFPVWAHRITSRSPISIL